MNTTTRPRPGAMRKRPCGCTLQYGLFQSTGSWAVTAPCPRHRNEVNQQDYASRGWYAPCDDQRILVREMHAWHSGHIRPARGGRSWTVLDGENEILDSGWAADEAGAKEAVADWAEADLLIAQITGDLLSAAFAEYGHTDDAVAHAALAVVATTQITC